MADTIPRYLKRPEEEEPKFDAKGMVDKLRGNTAKKVAVKSVKKATPKVLTSLPVEDMKGNFADGTKPPKEIKIDKQGLANKGLEMGGAIVGGPEGGAMSGAGSAMTTAASMGMVDPASLAVAGVIGGIAGGLEASEEASAAKRAAKEKAKAQHARDLVNIEQEKDSKIQSALGNMKAAFSKNLQNNKSVRL